MKSTRQMVVDPALRHLLQRHQRRSSSPTPPPPAVPAPTDTREAASSSRSIAPECGNFGCDPNPPDRASNCFSADCHQLRHQLRPRIPAAPHERLVVLDRRITLPADSSTSLPPLLKRLRHRQQHSLENSAVHAGPPAENTSRQSKASHPESKTPSVATRPAR